MGESQPEEDDDDIHGMGFYVKAAGRRTDARSELDKYLSEDCEPHSKFVEFDILNWWKVNSSRYPILASIAREVLAIPVSTFSAGGRVLLDPHRSNLTPNIVEVLVCTQDWLRGSPFSNLF
ncbi:zinc finger BED domain-containing protein ricesleeper 2-like, partial [Trifolium medium]|nr:zinc finger BED domain-containing protein ricesleeper 2-like [Trifolium medium]